MRRSSVVGLLLLVLAGGSLAACSGDDADGARALAQRLAAALRLDPDAPAGASSSPSAGSSASAEASASASASTSAAAGPSLATLPFSGVSGEQAQQRYAAIVDGLGRLRPAVEAGDVAVDGDAATAKLRWSWPVVDGGEAWTYTSSARLVRVDDAWAVRWSSALVQPELADGDVLDLTSAATPRAEITGAGGEVLVTERPVVRVGIDRSRLEADAAEGAARALARLVGIDVAPYVATVTKAGPKAFVEALTYRRDDVPAAVRAGLERIDGARTVDDELALAPTREFAAPLLGRVGAVTAEMVAKDPAAYRPGDIAGISGLQARYDAQLRGVPARTVYAVPAAAAAASAAPSAGASEEPSSAADEGGRRVLFQIAARPGKPLALTLDARLQSLGERILAGVGPASALVAIRPSDGAVLAAVNGPGTGARNDATFARFAPGSTFKIVSSLALLRAGLTPTSPVPCTPSVSVDGKRFTNYSDYPSSSLGRIELGEAVAQSCNTAFIGSRSRVGDGDLAAAAASLGLGVDHDLGFPAYFGQVPAPESRTEAAADLIGQGKVQASPMVMATVIASVQAGRTVVPYLVEGSTSPVPKQARKLSAAEVKALRTMLRRVVTEGSGRRLLGVPGGPVIAKTGTAEYADTSTGGEVRTHAWMVGAHDDIAVAVFVQTGETGSQTAGPLLERFLREAR
ncbi:penicillin-binding transpeptidase domain-containing protein [Nocardioides sp.]|uniref:penicillin-binding transpeptidase domain-containing protein n=1 Tax=Nocardioides sp. TaxID=35761 RepID=UPI0035110BC0